MMSKPKKNYLKMSAAELAAETGEFDTGAIPEGRPMKASMRALWDKARASGAMSIRLGRGRPKVGEGAVSVPISIEAGLLRRSVAKADSLKLKRSEYFAKALQLLTDGEVELAGGQLRVTGSERRRKTG